MSINIKNRRAEALLAELKQRTGLGTTDLFVELMEREKQRLDGDVEEKLARALEANRRIRERWLARPLLDPRPLDEMIQYDENGLPV